MVETLFLFLFFSIQNTALNLAATAGQASLVSYLLSVKEQEILLNKYNQNVLDLAIFNDKEEVAMAIIEHSRYVQNGFSSLARKSSLQRDNLEITTREVDTRESPVRLEFEMRSLCRLVFEVLFLVLSANGTYK